MANYYTVIETEYKYALILKNNEIVKTELNLKTFKTGLKNTIYPGDKVELDNDGLIISVKQRTNILSRDKKDLSKKTDSQNMRIIATNIDLAIIVVSCNTPPLHPKLIDRYIMLLEENNIPFIIVVNKIDMISNHEKNIIDLYRKMGNDVIETSTYKGIGVDTLLDRIKNKQSILLGHSGVGKSSLTNALLSCNDIRIGSLRIKDGKGCHTTTNSKIYLIDDNTLIMDTPGVRNINLKNYHKKDVIYHFKELYENEGKCKFNNCMHYKETIDVCYIKQLVEEGIINKDRYESFIKILDETK